MSLESDLATWRRRNDYRQRKLNYYHQVNDKAGIVKWEALRRDAGEHIQHLLVQITKAKMPTPRERIVAVAQQAKRNYNYNPYAYHYLAGGVPNNIILKPTPFNWRSDCSLFAVSVYKIAGLPCPGSGTFLASNTISMVQRGHRTYDPKPGDFGFYGLLSRPHHVEIVVDTNPLVFIGHGSRPIDSLTPGFPDFFWTYDFLN